MRRKDREMSQAFGEMVIDKARYAVLTIVDIEGNPYAIPISPVRIDNQIYIHSAQAGHKVDCLQDGIPYQMVFVGEVEVPELYTEEQLDEMLVDQSKATNLARTVFTTQFESAIVKGLVYRVVDDEERVQAFRTLARKYCPSKERLIELAIQAGGPHAYIYSFTIEELTAKRKKYDAHGEEMKWGRID